MEIQGLRRGDKVVILSPASSIRPEYVEGAVSTFREWGWRPEVMPHTLGSRGSFSGSVQERLADFSAALLDPEVRAIICSRGGYGCVHLLGELDRLMSTPLVRDNPKWLVGFSDVSALHALWGLHGLPSVHASMTKQLAAGGPDNLENLSLRDILRGQVDGITLPTALSGSEYGRENRCGDCRGMVVGGNLAVLGGLIGTPFNPIRPGTILLVEDIAEPIYKVERILWQLRLAGIFDRLAGLLVGQFTDYNHPSRDYSDMYAMIADFTRGCGFPVAMDIPVGHIDGNRPLLLNRPARMSVTPDSVNLDYL